MSKMIVHSLFSLVTCQHFIQIVWYLNELIQIISPPSNTKSNTNCMICSEKFTINMRNKQMCAHLSLTQL